MIEKLLCLTKYPMDGASSRYRVYQYVETWEARGVTVKVSPFWHRAAYHRRIAPRNRLSALVNLFCDYPASVLRRLFVIFSAGRYDAVLLQREAVPSGPAVFEKLLRSRARFVVFDLDDAIHLTDAHQDAHQDANQGAGRNENVLKTRTAKRLHSVDRVIAGNPALARLARNFNDAVTVIENGEDSMRTAPLAKPARPSPLVVGWIGSPSTAKYLEHIGPELVRFQKDHPDSELWVIGAKALPLEGLRVRYFEWSLETEVALVQQFDIGLMPLRDDGWSKFKSAGKLRFYMAAGVPVLASPIGLNRQVIDNGKTGLLVEGDWFEKLSLLADEPDLRKRLATAAREVVVREYDLEETALRVLDTLDPNIPLARPFSP